MDYAGLDHRRLRYPVNRKLTDDEKAHRLDRKRAPQQEPNDGLMVVTLNSTYIELVDRWYHVKGFNVWLGAMVAMITLFLFYVVSIGLLGSPARPDEEWVAWVVLPIVFPLLLLFLYASLWLVKTEAFRKTHYPMILNRETRDVHVFRQDGTVLTTPWDSLFVVLGTSTMPPLGETQDVRAHVLAEDGVTVSESFTLCYSYMGNADANLRLWAFIRRYMEDKDGVERTFEHMEETFCLPIDGRKEGLRWGILRTFMTSIRFPALQMLFCLPFALTAMGRFFAMSSSSQPQWPAATVAANVVMTGDPFTRTWRDNPELTTFQVLWPSLCFVAGMTLAATIVMALLLGD